MSRSAMTTDNELSCKELVELVTEYFEGVLPGDERARFERHLEGCEGCRNYLKQMQQTMRLLGCLTEETLSTEAKEALLETFRDWKKGL